MADRKHNEQNAVNVGQLRGFIQRIEHVEEEQAQLADDKKVIYAEVKAMGFDPKIVRAAISRRKKDPDKLREFEEMLELYMDAIGDLAGTPIGDASSPKTR